MLFLFLEMKILFVDMDNVLVDFKSGIKNLSEKDKNKYLDNYDEAPRIFSLRSERLSDKAPPKKRGRKPKNKYNVVENISTMQIKKEESIILHLPINTSNIKSIKIS